ncbi:hypothetical protein [Serpentinicella alkaliphila]|uniref:hypothetical protein n=1 Tax=Serpentinicella alkaliphila TaxID=1734049 RepID=UPI001050A35C|nr:hypothetical protein [Serpentinicella alkaliphila]QUH24485.1 hypothetical protein HZR23_00850 [Serpentinicella alkaliphila]
MILVNLCDDHHPLSRLNEYYEYKDLESIFNYPVTLSQINDDRLVVFLIFYMMLDPEWGTYEVDGEDAGVIQIRLTMGIVNKNVKIRNN